MSRFADQSKALWRQHNNTLTSSSTMNNGRNGGGGGATLGDETAAIYAGGSSRQHKRLNKGDGCLGRCPFASVIATIITLCGTGIFTACLYRALTITLQMWTASFKVELDFEWTRVVQTVALVVAAFMCSLAFILLFVGCLATGATRMQVYTGFRSRLGGRISTGFFIVVVYALIGVWSCVTLALVVPLVAYYILVQNCTFKSKQINNHTQQKMDECISLKNFGIELGENKVSVCSNELIAFCNQVLNNFHFFKRTILSRLLRLCRLQLVTKL